MPRRTQIVCLHEGKKDSIDAIFINRLIRALDPSWLRPFKNGNLHLKPCGNRSGVLARLPTEICVAARVGGSTTVMVWADCDDDCHDGEALKNKAWEIAQREGIARADFDNVVFVFAKDRIENWVQFLNTGATDETQEGPRVSDSAAAQAAKKLADVCVSGQSQSTPNIPSSLAWSCKNWKALVNRMKCE